MNKIIDNDIKPIYREGTKNPIGGYPFPFNTVNHLQFQSARKGLNTPVSAFGNGAGSIPMGLLVTPELFCLLNRKASEKYHRRQAMPKISNTAVSQPSPFSSFLTPTNDAIYEVNEARAIVDFAVKFLDIDLSEPFDCDTRYGLSLVLADVSKRLEAVNELIEKIRGEI